MRLVVLSFMLLCLISCKDESSSCKFPTIPNHTEKQVIRPYTCAGLIQIDQKQKIIINDSASYYALFNKCPKKPNMDYKNKLYVGMYTESGGCDINPKRYIHQEGDTFHYDIHIKSSGSCKQLWFSYNLIELPKMNPDNVKIHVTICENGNVTKK